MEKRLIEDPALVRTSKRWVVDTSGRETTSMLVGRLVEASELLKMSSVVMMLVEASGPLKRSSVVRAAMLRLREGQSSH